MTKFYATTRARIWLNGEKHFEHVEFNYTDTKGEKLFVEGNIYIDRKKNKLIWVREVGYAEDFTVSFEPTKCGFVDTKEVFQEFKRQAIENNCKLD